MKVKLLVVDDEKEICDFVRSFFEGQGLEVFSALSGKEALKIFEKEKPQIILLDILMNGMNGIELLRRIKQLDKNNDVFMITQVKDDPEKVKEAKRLGVVDYITKPLTLENLEKVVMERVERIKQQSKGKE